jgi:hypothetical protein
MVWIGTKMVDANRSAPLRAYVNLSAGLAKENSAEKNYDAKQSSGLLSPNIAVLTRIPAELSLSVI